MEIGIYLRKLRVSKKYTQEQVAHNLNISREAYTAWEAGRIELTIERLDKVASLYGFTAKDLLISCELSNSKKS